MTTTSHQTQQVVYHIRLPMQVDEATTLGHIGIFAQTGSGKGVFGQALAGFHYMAGYKVIDWDVSRQENTLYPFPNKDRSMVDRIIKCNRTPRGFPCEVLFPLTSKDGLIGETYPENWRPFKIDFADLTPAEIILMLEDATPQAINVVNSLLFNNNTKPRNEQIKSLGEFIDVCFDLHLKLKYLAKTTTNLETGKTYKKPVSIHTSTLSSLEREGMALFEKGIISDKTEKITFEIFSRAINETITQLKSIEKNSFLGRREESICLDVNDIMNNHATITSINLFSCKSFREKALCFSWFWRKVMELRKTKEKKIRGEYPPILFRCAEAHSFAPSTGIAMEGSDHSKKIMQEIATEGRDAGIRMLLDTQGSKQLNSFVCSQLSVFYLGRMDKNNIEHFHDKINSIPEHWVMKDKIQKQEVGTFTKIWKNSLRYRYPLFVCPALNRSKEANQNIKDIYREKLNYLGEKFGWYTLNYQPKVKVGFTLISAKEKNELLEEVGETIKKPATQTNYEKVMNFVKEKFVTEKAMQVELTKVALETEVSIQSVYTIVTQQPGKEEIMLMEIQLVKIAGKNFLKKIPKEEKKFRKEQTEKKIVDKKNVDLLAKKFRRAMW